MQDRNLERNLARLEGLRARGGLAKVRRKLEELVREQPGTPDYRRELARACLDLGDMPAGLTEIRHLMRQQPAQRGEWRELVSQDLLAHGNPMAAQFLLEDSLGRGEHDEAQAFLEQLAEEQLDQLAQRYLVKIDNLERHQAVESAGASAADAPPLRLARWCIFHCALARKRCDAAAQQGARLLTAGDEERQRLLQLLERRQRQAAAAPPLLALLGEARLLSGRHVDGLVALFGAAERDPALVPAIEKVCERLAPMLGELPALARTRGHLARLTGRSEEAIVWYRRAIAADPEGAASLLDLLPAAGEAAAPYVPLRLELLALAGNPEALAAALQQMRAAGQPAASLRAALNPHLEAQQPNAAVVVCALQLALDAGAADDLERMAPVCARLSGAQLRKAIRAVEQGLCLEPVETAMVPDPITGEMVPAAAPIPAARTAPAAGQRRAGLRFLARLHAAAGDAAGAAKRLHQMWREQDGEPERLAELFALTHELAGAIAPTASLVASMVDPAVQQGHVDLLASLCAGIADDDADEMRQLERQLIAAARSAPAVAAALRRGLEGGAAGSQARLDIARAAAGLFGGAEARAVAELEALAGLDPQREMAALDLLLARCAASPPDASATLAAARLLRLDDRLDEAAELLRPLLAGGPADAERASLFCESVLADQPQHVPVWRCYLESLLRGGAHRRLRQVLPEAEQRLPATEIGRLRVYRARLLFEDGDLAGAVAEGELVLQLADPPLDLLAALAADVTAADDSLGRAHRLAGSVALARGDTQAGLAALARALSREPRLRAEIIHQVGRLEQDGRLPAGAWIELGRFYLQVERPEEASHALLEALRREPASAAAVCDLLQPAVERAAQPAPLLPPLARALWHAGRHDEAAAAHLRLLATDPSRLDWILKELALVEAAAPDDPDAARCRVRVLLQAGRYEQAGALLAAQPQRAAQLLPPPRLVDQAEAGVVLDAWAALPAELTALPHMQELNSLYWRALAGEQATGGAAAPDAALAEAAETSESDEAARQACLLRRAEQLAAEDRLLEAADLLRPAPLSGPDCRLDEEEQARALWLLAHGEEARGNFPAALACYRRLAVLPGEHEAVRRWRNWSYGQFLRRAQEEAPLIIEKTTLLV